MNYSIPINDFIGNITIPMNDFIEFVTWPTNQNLFRRIRTKALVFHVKGQKAAVGLSARSGKDCCYWVLCGYNMIWEKTIGDKIPSGSVKGGYSEVNHEILYIGRAYHNGHVIPGKVQPSHNVCCFSYEDKEEYSPKYEILVYSHPCPSAGDHYVTCFGNTNNDGKSSTSNSTVEVQ